LVELRSKGNVAVDFASGMRLQPHEHTHEICRDAEASPSSAVD